MASYLRPRRGKKATAVAQLTASAPLKRGEVFFEVPDGGVGTGAGKIKMGDGSTAYSSLPYFLEQTEEIDIDTATVGFTNSTAAESSPYSTNATHANAIVPSASMKTIFTNLKQLLLNYNSQLTTLNNDLKEIEVAGGGNIKYDQTTDYVQIYGTDKVWHNWKMGGLIIDTNDDEFTQDEFIAACGLGLQSQMKIGAIIHLNNTLCNTYRIIGVNHDNTTGTIDVMPTTQVANMQFSNNNQYWANSLIRTWINGEFLMYFDQDVQDLMKVMDVVTSGSTLKDKAKLLSWKELGLTSSYMDSSDGGTQYSVFTAGAYDTKITDRWIPAGTNGNSSAYWMRSRDANYSGRVWYVSSDGSCGYDDCTGTYGVAPVLRF